MPCGCQGNHQRPCWRSFLFVSRAGLVEVCFREPAFDGCCPEQMQKMVNFCQTWRIVCEGPTSRPPPVYGPGFCMGSFCVFAVLCRNPPKVEVIKT